MLQPPQAPGVIHVHTWRDTWTLAFSALTAIGTLAVAIAAVWGDWLRARFAPPRLTLKLRDEGFVIPRQDGTRAIYHLILVENWVSWWPKWSPAKAVRVVVTEIRKRGPDGKFYPEPLVYEFQLTWSPSEFHELFPTIIDKDQCDLGFLNEHDSRFRLQVYVAPFNFPGSIAAGEAMRVTVVAKAHNGRSKPLVIEIAWDGVWLADSTQMKKHLVVSPV